MKMRIVKVLGGWVSALLLTGSWLGVAEAVECVSQDLSMSCHRTIQGALAVAAPGEDVFVYPGTYTENVSIDIAGVRVVGQGGWPGQVAINAPGGVIVSLNAPKTSLKNVTVHGGETGIVVTGTGATIDDVTVRASIAGISVTSDGVRVINSAVRQIEGTGIGAEGASFVVLSSIVQEIGGPCIQVTGDGALIGKNRIMDCGQQGVKIEGGAASVLENDLSVAGLDLISVTGPAARIRENTLQGGRRGAITANSDSPIVVNNSVRDCDTGIDVQCDSCAGALLSDNFVSGIYNCPGFIVVAGSSGVVVRDNISRGSSDEGFVLRGSGIVARRNKAFDNGLDGIRVEQPSIGVQLIQNKANTNARDGIRIESGVTGTKVKKNRAHANGDVDFYNAGTGTILGTGVNRNYFGTVGP